MLREDEIHIAIRKFLTSEGWLLLGGEFPDGSDDTLRRIHIRNPLLARDKSPDPRRHSKDTEKLDLVALRDKTLLLIEMKPAYSASDVLKLRRIIANRKTDLFKALKETCNVLEAEIQTIVPAIGYEKNGLSRNLPGFIQLLVHSNYDVEIMES